MRSALWRLSTNPTVLQKLREEIDTIGPEEPITYKLTQTLPYLKAVVRESLRMYPSVPAPLYRIVPAGGITVDGQLIPPGTVVGISSLAQNRDTAIFGQDPNVFNPDRWLGDEAEARYMEAALFNFGGSGPRSCPGRDLAMVSQRNLLRRHMLILHDRLSYTNLSLRLSRSSILRWWTRHIHSR
jgi:cytochrome P450